MISKQGMWCEVQSYCSDVIPFSHSSFVKNPMFVASSFQAKTNITIWRVTNTQCTLFQMISHILDRRLSRKIELQELVWNIRMNFANIFWLNSDVLTELLHTFWSDNVIWSYTHNNNKFQKHLPEEKQKGHHLTLIHVYGLIANDAQYFNKK